MKFLLLGRCAWLIVCQAMIIALMVVFPAPVASFKAKRTSSGLAWRLALAKWSRNSLPVLPACGATSVSQIYSFKRLHLAEERPGVAELVVPPMPKQARGLGCDMPIVGIRYASPLVYVTARLIDYGRGGFLFPLLGGKPFTFVKYHSLLSRDRLTLPGFRNQRNELRLAAALNDSLGWLALGHQSPNPVPDIHAGSREWVLKNH